MPTTRRWVVSIVSAVVVSCLLGNGGCYHSRFGLVILGVLSRPVMMLLDRRRIGAGCAVMCCRPCREEPEETTVARMLARQRELTPPDRAAPSASDKHEKHPDDRERGCPPPRTTTHPQEDL